MNSASWFLLVGALMLAKGLTAPFIGRLPVTSAIVYLAVGLLVGPTVFGLFHFNPLKQSAFLEVLTEVVVLISLFSAGVKMPVPVTFARWRAPISLAFFSMTITVTLVAGLGHYVLGLSLGAAVLLGAILAPTDPVLATDVQTRHPHDRDQLRFTLTCEAGMNDGTAFPFVILGMGLLGLHQLGDFGHRWLLVDVLWATFAGIAIGATSGWGLAHVAVHLRRKRPATGLLNDFLGLGLIGTATPWRIRGLAGWFGVRGIGSLYYLMYAIQHGLPEGLANELIHLTLMVVALSIVVHGISIKPMMRKFWRRRQPEQYGRQEID